MNQVYRFRPASRGLLVVRVTEGSPNVFTRQWTPLAIRSHSGVTDLYYHLPLRWRFAPPQDDSMPLNRTSVEGLILYGAEVEIDEGTAVALAEELKRTNRVRSISIDSLLGGDRPDPQPRLKPRPNRVPFPPRPA